MLLLLMMTFPGLLGNSFYNQRVVFLLPSRSLLRGCKTPPATTFVLSEVIMVENFKMKNLVHFVKSLESSTTSLL